MALRDRIARLERAGRDRAEAVPDDCCQCPTEGPLELVWFDDEQPERCPTCGKRIFERPPLRFLDSESDY